jgi:hypothetical protein
MPFDPKRIDRLAAKATLLEEQVHALVSELEELAELARAESKPEPIVAHDPEPVAAPEPVAPAEPEPDDVPEPASVAEAEPAAEAELEPVSESKPPSSVPEGARLVALNMALSGTPRDETARYLRENYDLEDPGPLLDDVYAKAGS